MKQFVQFFYIPTIIVFLFVFGLMNCARESRPTGGPIDTLAPVVIREKPHNNATLVRPSKIKIVFDEKIQLNSGKETCLISPFFETPPNITARKKKLIIHLKKHPLEDNTTYTFNFSNAIKDVHEGTAIEQYVYAFSTGQSIDSLKIQGSVRIAETNEIPEDCHVLLYAYNETFLDSSIYVSMPTYTTKVSEQGTFMFSNIQQGTYAIYAIVDKNKDFRYSPQAQELIAFLDTLIVPEARILSDTVRVPISKKNAVLHTKQADSLAHHIHTDSLLDTTLLSEKDTFYIQTRTHFFPDNIQLNLFTNQPHTQSIRSRSRVSPYLYTLAFSLPITENSFRISSNHFASNAYSFEVLPSQDSVLIWLHDTTLIYADSAQLILSHAQKNNTYTDTVFLMKSKDMPARLEFSDAPKSTHTVFPYDTITVHASRPLKTMHTHARLFMVKDTIALQDSYGNYIDTAHIHNEHIRQQAPITKPFIPKYYYESQQIINQNIGNGRFALYFSKPFDIHQISIRLAEYPDLQNWYIAEVDSTTNSLLCWITDTRAARLKNPIMTVTYKDKEIEKEQIISFSTIFSQTERYRNHRPPRPIPFIHDYQKQALFIHNVIEIIWNNPIQEFSDSLFVLYDATDSLKKNCITNIQLSPHSKRTLYIYHSADIAKNYVLTLQKNAIRDIYAHENKEFSTTIATQKLVNVSHYTPVPCEYNLHENNRTYSVTANWEPQTNYQLIFPHAAAEDIYGAVSDSLCIQINCPKLNTYGSLIIEIDSINTQEHYLFELRKKGASESEVVTQVYQNTGSITFTHLTADEYTLSCVLDTNKNGLWDTGSLEQKQQAEIRIFFPDKIQIKANWENRISWNIQKQLQQ